MKRLVPSTPGEVSFVVRRRFSNLVVPAHFAKFASVREEANNLIAELDTPDSPVSRIEIHYTFPVGKP